MVNLMNDIKELTNIYITYNNTNIEEKLGEIIRSNKTNNEKFKSIQELLNNSKQVFSKLKQLINKNSNLISSVKAIELSNKIEHIIDSLNTLDNDINDILTSVTTNTIQKFQSHIEDYNTKTNELSDMMFESLGKYQENLYFAVKNNILTLDDLNQIKQEQGLNQEQIEAIDNIIVRLQKEKELTGNDEILAEQASIEDKKGKLSENPDDTFSDVINVNAEDITSMSLKERLNNIQYNEDTFYGADVEQVRIEYELEQLNKRIQSLKNQERLSFKQAIELHSLVTQAEQLNEMLFNIELGRKDLRREEQLARTSSKVSSKENDILETQEKQANSNSKLFKYVSARKEKKLTEQLDKLKAQMGVIQSKQRESVLLKFDKQNNRLMKKSKRQATKRVIVQTTKDKIQKLKDLKNNVVTEVRNIKNDIKNRFVHKPEMVNEMRNEKIVITGQPIEIVPVENLSMSMQM